MLIRIPSRTPYWLFALSLLLYGDLAWAETVSSIIIDTQIQYRAPDQNSACIDYVPSWHPWEISTAAAYADWLTHWPIPGTICGGYRTLDSSSYSDLTISFTYHIGSNPSTISRINMMESQTVNTYSCPPTGTWILSADQQTCTGCWDSSKVLNEEGACVSPKDKGAGPGCEKSSDQPSNQPPPWSTSP